MYIIIFFAFVVMCHIYYGADLTDFGTITQSLITLFQMLLGNLDFLDDMIVLNKLLSFFFFIAFMTSMQFILINMFIAFISNAYSTVNDDASDENKTIEDFKYKHWMVKIKDLWHTIRKTSKRTHNKNQDKDKNKSKIAKDLLAKNMSKKK
jgi:hypothetical protein